MCPAGKLKEWSLLFYGTAEHPYNTLGAPQPRARPPEASEMEPSRAAFLQSQVEVAEEEEEYAGKSRGVAPKHPQNANWDELGGLGGRGGREERCLWPERGSRMAKLEGGEKKSSLSALPPQIGAGGGWGGKTKPKKILCPPPWCAQRDASPCPAARGGTGSALPAPGGPSASVPGPELPSLAGPCHPECGDQGCDGPSADQCLNCIHYSLGSVKSGR